MISNKEIIFGGICFVAGAGAGFLVSFGVAKKHFEEEKKAILEDKNLKSITPKSQEKSPDAIKDAKKAAENLELKPSNKTKTEADYKQYDKIVKSYKPEEDPTTDPDPHFNEGDVTDLTDEEAEYQKAKGSLVELLGDAQYDPEWPEQTYDISEVTYFENDDILAEEGGAIIKPEDTIGKANLEAIKSGGKLSYWVRNNPEEIDFHVTVTNDSYESWYGDQS